MDKHSFVLGVSYTINPGEKGEYHYEYFNLYDYVKLTIRDDIKIHEVDVYNYSRSINKKIVKD